MHLRGRVGTPSEPVDPARRRSPAPTGSSTTRAAVDGCPTPIDRRERAQRARARSTPWTATNRAVPARTSSSTSRPSPRAGQAVPARHRAPRTPAARPADWWRQVARSPTSCASPTSPRRRSAKQGPVLGSRTLREHVPERASAISRGRHPAAQLGLMLGFQTTPGSGGRERASSRRRWLEVDEAAGARRAPGRGGAQARVGLVVGLGDVLGTRGDRSRQGRGRVRLPLDARARALRRARAPRARASTPRWTEGQLVLPAGAHSARSSASTSIRADAISALTRSPATSEVAFTAPSPAWSRERAYDADRGQAGARPPSGARDLQLRRLALRVPRRRSRKAHASVDGRARRDRRRAAPRRRSSAGCHVPRPTAGEIQSLLRRRTPTSTRGLVESKARPPWLGNRRRRASPSRPSRHRSCSSAPDGKCAARCGR